MFKTLFERLGNEFEEERNMLLAGKPRTSYSFLMKKKEKLNEKGIFLLGVISFLIGKYKESIEYLLLSLKTNTIYLPEDNVYEVIGVAFYNLGNNLEAKNYFIKSMEKNPENFESKYNLANIFLLDKNFESAYKLFVDLKEIEPQNDNIKRNLKYLENKVKTM
jgi:tetratricopeptide (TPR) repeat protein